MVHEDDAPFYEVVALACHACRARDLVSGDAVEANGGKAHPGRYYAVSPKR